MQGGVVHFFGLGPFRAFGFRPYSGSVPISPQVRSGMSNAGVATRHAGMDRLHGVRLRFVDHHAVCSCLQGLTADAEERHHAAGQRPIMLVFWD